MGRGGEPVLVAPGQDHLGAGREIEGGQDGQADLTRAAEKEDPAHEDWPFRRFMGEPGTSRAYQRPQGSSAVTATAAKSSVR